MQTTIIHRLSFVKKWAQYARSLALLALPIVLDKKLTSTASETARTATHQIAFVFLIVGVEVPDSPLIDAIVTNN